jgi:hypothetical protein
MPIEVASQSVATISVTFKRNSSEVSGSDVAATAVEAARPVDPPGVG